MGDGCHTDSGWARGHPAVAGTATAGGGAVTRSGCAENQDLSGVVVCPVDYRLGNVRRRVARSFKTAVSGDSRTAAQGARPGDVCLIHCDLLPVESKVSEYEDNDDDCSDPPDEVVHGLLLIQDFAAGSRYLRSPRRCMRSAMRALRIAICRFSSLQSPMRVFSDDSAAASSLTIRPRV